MDADARLDEAVGSVAEEAARLLEALGRSSRPPADPAGADPAGANPTAADPTAADPAESSDDDPGGTRDHVHVAMGDAQTCTWCPVCRSVTLLRGLSPETLGSLAELATTAATVLADLATRHTQSPHPAPADRPSTAERTPRTEPITVVDEEDVP